MALKFLASMAKSKARLSKEVVLIRPSILKSLFFSSFIVNFLKMIFWFSKVMASFMELKLALSCFTLKPTLLNCTCPVRLGDAVVPEISKLPDKNPVLFVNCPIEKPCILFILSFSIANFKSKLSFWLLYVPFS